MACKKVDGTVSKINRFQEAIVFSSGKFRVDEQGRVWRKDKRAEHKTTQYLQVNVMINGVMFYTCAHRLVWHALVGPIPEGMVINHKNGLKTDNRVENLEVVTPSENTKHAHATGLIDQYGERNPATTVSDATVARIRQLYASGGRTMKEVGEVFGVSFRYVSRVVNGTRRAKQTGPISKNNRKNNKMERCPITNRFVSKKQDEAKDSSPVEQPKRA